MSTMTKGLLVLSVISVLFAAVALVKFRTSNINSNNNNNELTLAKKERIQQFWELYRRATELRIAGRPQQAIAAYRQALELNHQHENTLYYLGSLYFEIGEHKEAEQLWKRLVEVNPNSSRAHVQLGTLYLHSQEKAILDLQAAKAEFRKALEINKEETGPLIPLGQIALIEGNLSEARGYFEAVLGSNYRSGEAYFLNGFVAWKLGEEQKALDMLKKAIKFSHPEEPKPGISGEGDTKTARSLVKLNRHALFQNHVQDLSSLSEKNLSQQMAVRYQEMEATLARTRAIVQP